MLERLTTEQRNPDSLAIDALETVEIVKLMNREDELVISAVGAEVDNIANAIDHLVSTLRGGGRLIYMGAGTSGRLGVLDASECPPTFNTDPAQVVGLIAGGYSALVQSIEGAEDHPEHGANDLDKINLSDRDMVVGIATSGRTPFVIGGLRHARTLGCVTVGISCNEKSQLADVADIMITPVVGPEVISGSTRLKAGTATKLVLNMLTTGAMVQLGKTYGNLMVDLRATNSKLRDRTRRILMELTSLDDVASDELLDCCDGELKTAIVAHQLKLSPVDARKTLNESDGRLRQALAQVDP